MKNETHIQKFRNYLLGEECSKGTIHSYTKTIEQFLELINKNSEDIDQSDIQRFKIYCNTKGNNGKPYDRNTLVPKYSAIKSFIRYLGKPEEWINKRHLKVRRIEPKPKQHSLTPQQAQDILKASEIDIRDSAILKVLYYTSIRRAELSNLNLADIDYTNQTLTTWNMKGNRSVERPIHSIALESIKAYLKVRAIKPTIDRRKHETQEQCDNRKEDIKKALFLGRSGTHRLGKTDVSTLLKKYSSRAGIPFRVNSHMLRHAFVTHAYYELGWTLKDIQHQTKHKSIDVIIAHYVDIDKVAYKKKYEDGFHRLSNDEEHISKEEPEPKLKPKTQPEQEAIDKTDKYIALLKDGLIGKDDFIKLVSGNVNKDDITSFYQ